MSRRKEDWGLNIILAALFVLLVIGNVFQFLAMTRRASR